jgi:hypothetical protein
MRRVRALVQVEGEEREMEFFTNNLQWSATSVNPFRQQLTASPLQHRITGAALSPCGKRVKRNRMQKRKAIDGLFRRT